METRKLVKIIILVLLCLIVHIYTSKGQLLYSRDAKITVFPNTILCVRGSVENEGIITNHGHLKVADRWVNSGTYHTGEGQITFNSTSSTIPQIIHHNGQTFNRITVAGGTKKIILSDMVVGKAVSFEDGIIESSGNSKIVFEAGVSISGASDRSHIHGRVFQNGSGPKLFPIGNGVIYLPVELDGIDDPAARVGVQAFEFEDVALGKAPALQSISNKRYWRIDATSDVMTRARVILPLRDELWITDPEKAVVAQSSAPSSDFVSIGGSLLKGDGNSDRVASAFGVTMPFIALATAAAERKLVVYNAVSPNGDGLNDFLRIENIEDHPNNRFTLFNRWGDKVFEVDDYNNGDRAFKGRSNLQGDSELVTGTYFYVLDLAAGETLRGFIGLKH